MAMERRPGTNGLPRAATWLLRFFPAPVRHEFGAEILGTLAVLHADRAPHVPSWRFWLSTVADMAAAGLRMRWRSALRRLRPRRTPPGLSGPRHRRPAGTPSPRWSPSPMGQDLRYALRALRKSPGFTTTAVLLLGVGIGANAAVFSLVSTFLLKPYPYPEAERIVTVHSSSERWGIDFGNVSLSDYHDLRTAETGLESVALYGYRSYNVASADAAVWVPTAHVSANFFDLLGVDPLMGRTFLAGDDEPGGNVVVIAESLWRNELGADPHVVGSELQLDGEPHRVVGVVPAGTEYPDTRRMWKAYLGTMDSEPRYRRVYRAIGRISVGETLDSVRPRVEALGSRLSEAYPDSNTGMNMVVRTLRDQRDGDVRPMLVTLSGAAGFVLLLVCANLATLLTGRARNREREVAIRSALGAGRARITRQLVLESLTIAAVGGVLGAVSGQQVVRLLMALRPRPLPEWYTIALDWRVIGFTTVVSALAALAFGLLPALRLSRNGVQDALRTSDRGATVSAGERRLPSGLVTLEVALSVVLLVGAGLMVASFRNITAVDPGFELDDRVTLGVSLPATDYDPGAVARFVGEFEGAVRELPGVRAAGGVALLPLMGTGTTGITAEGQSADEAAGNPEIQYSPVTPDYFSAIGISLLEGRAFTAADDGAGDPVVIVSEGLARRFWPDGDVVGRRLRQNDVQIWRTVVGVVNDVRQAGLTGEIEPQMYLPYPQEPWRQATFVVHTEADPGAVLTSVRDVLRRIDPRLASHNVITLEELHDLHAFDWRFSALVFWIFAAIAGVLASIGVYAILASGVARRTRELGIRKALGASSESLVAMVAREAGWLIGAGLLLGLVAAFVLSGLLASQLYAVDPHDPLIFALVALLVAAVAVIATVRPARRAARLDPMSALRTD